MRRKKLAVALACLLGLLASGLAGVFAFLELSPRDYRMVWLLRRTKTIELTARAWKNGRIVAITDPREVAAVVSAMTVKLDRTREELGESYHRARFVLEDGSDVVARFRREPLGSMTLLQRAGQAGVYATSDEALSKVLWLQENHYIELGSIEVEGRELVACLWAGDAPPGLPVYFVALLNPGTREKCALNKVGARLVWRDGASTTLLWQRAELEAEAEKPYENLLRVGITSGGRTWSFPAPPARYDAEAARLWK